MDSTQVMNLEQNCLKLLPLDSIVKLLWLGLLFNQNQLFPDSAPELKDHFFAMNNFDLKVL